ncbi:hypothetical protein Pla123a_18240 [Posidoniimonas polymericola]|uniref:Uncharacterized protein n=1 Tax=Posidoniimonas polymericola TaxID=2528002 RepID=A0A5C5YSP2_9BACT|nr:AsmA-like C-terminal region-containing protein [Posidoniimonas polymericola]TWT78024.1 hypothetical protein Pla123a_18240 [Posidoniimonas polymericola]
MGRVVKFCWSCFKWGAGIALVLAVTVGGYLYFKLDEEITRYAQQYLAGQYAELDVHVGSARYVRGSGVVVSGIEIDEPQPGGPAVRMLEIPELRLVGEIDAEAITTRQPKFERIELIRPRLSAVRQADGAWNFERLRPAPSDSGPSGLPVHIHDATIALSDSRKPEAEPVTLRNVDLKITSGPAEPGAAAGVQQITIEGQAEDTLAKLVRVQGAVDSDGGRLDLTIDVSQLGVTTQRLMAAPGVPTLLLAGLDLDAKLDSRTTLKRLSPAAPIDWLCDFHVSKGTLSHPLLPKQMTEVDLRGKCDQAGVRIKQATANNGAAELSAAINVLGWGPEARAAGWLKALKLELNNDVYRVLPDSLKRGWERFDPAGEVDATAYFWTAPGRVWSDVKIDGHNLSFEDNKKFPYRLTGGTGSLRFVDKQTKDKSRLVLSLNAQGEGRAVQIAGEFQGLPLPPERRGECPPGVLRVSSNAMRVTPRLLAALPPKAGRVLDSLHPEGEFGIVWTMRRDSLAQPEPELTTDLLIHDASVRFEKFPYPIRRLTGRVEQRGKQWTFTELRSRGESGGAMLTAAGAFYEGEDPPRLELAINGAGVPLDETLRSSLTDEEQSAWASLQPAGRVNFQSHIHYLSGEPKPQVKLTVQPQGQTVSMQPRFFQYRLDAIEGEFEINDDSIRFNDARARHGPTHLMADGEYQKLTGGGWKFDLLQVNVERLAINADFRAAAPLGLKKVIDCLEPQGGIGVHDGRLSFSHNGDPSQPIQSAWDVFVDCVQLDVNAGVRVDDIYGTVRVTGNGAGASGHSFGELQLDSLMWNGMQLTKVTGPIFCDQNICRLGRGVAEINRGQPRPITAQGYGGVVTMDGHAVLGLPSQYGMQVQLTAVDLGRLNTDYLHNASGITGKLSGEVTVQGSGNTIYGMTGAGRLQATEADLYELPLLVSMLKVLRNRPVDSTAFNTVTADFTMQGDDILFEHLDLEGDAISLYGRGEANLDRQLNLVFHTMVGRNGLAAPVLRTLAGQASEQLFKIRVTGKMDEAVVTNEPVPLVSNVFQQLQKDFRPQPLTRPAQLPDAAAQRR